jgi:starch synthase
MCASEVVPFAKTGGLADVVGALPLVLEKEGQEVLLILPFYKEVKKANVVIHKLRAGVSYAGLGKNIKIYFIEQDLYFNRDGLYGDKTGDYKDNLDRFSYYCKMALELLKEIHFVPDILHCHDWQSALIPVYLKALYAKDSFYKNTKTILTIHNLGYQGLFPKEEFPKLGLDAGFFNMDMLEFHGKVNILKGGIVCVDYISTVSPTYAKEIQSDELGFGLEGVLHTQSGRLSGILNGLDYSIWNPETDAHIVSTYSVSDLGGKQKNKEELQKVFNLPVRPEVPLFGIVSRLAEQKGFDLLALGMEEICKMGVQLAILGTGELKYHRLLAAFAKKYPDSLSLQLKFSEELAHKIYAGSDAFLMPSRYEPCGLGQLISLRYGSVPVVFKTGGLADTVTHDHGFVFTHYKKEDLLKTLKEAVGAFADKNKWDRLVKNAMECNFSWEASAKEYIHLYEKAKHTA